VTTAWNTALRDPSIAIHWLLEIDAGGLTLRYADADLVVGDAPYLGGMEVNRLPSLGFDPYQGQANAVVATVVLAPNKAGGKKLTNFRAHDIADTFRVDYVGLVARLYRWAKGTGSADRDLIIDGNVTAASVRGKTELELEVSDFTLKYSRKVLPPIVVDTDAFPDAPEDDIGRRGPIMYGTFTDIEVPCINAATEAAPKHLIGLPIASITDGRISGELATTPTLASVAATSTTPAHATATYAALTTQKYATISGTGIKDDEDGTFSESSLAVMNHVSSQLHHLAHEVTGIPAAKIDVPSFTYLREKTSPRESTIVLAADDKIGFFGVAQIALMPYRGAIYHERGLLRIGTLDLDGVPVVDLRYGEMLADVDEIEWRDIVDTVPGGIEIKYARQWNEKKKEYATQKIKRVRIEDYVPFEIAFNLGAEELKLEFPYITATETVNDLVAYVKDLHRFNRRRVSLRVTRGCHNVRIFDTVLVTLPDAPSDEGAGWTDKKFAVIGIAYGAEESTLTLLEC